MIVSAVRQTIRRRRLLGPGERVIVACSGGPDSVAMTHALARLASPLELSLTVAVVDHGLRDVASEISLVRALAKRLALPCRTVSVEVEEGASVQGAARKARYAALLDLASEIGAGRVAVGHTRDDQAETVLGRLLRGASVSGLSGIAPKRRDGVIRPLIDVRRDEVRAHLAHHSLAVAEDPSNRDPRFERVRIRDALLPALAEEDPRVVDHLADLADDARATRRLVRRAGRRLMKRARRGAHEAGLAIATLAAADEASRRSAIRHFLQDVSGDSPRRSHLEDVDALVMGAVGPAAEVRLDDAHVVARKRGALVVIMKKRENPGREGSRSPNH